MFLDDSVGSLLRFFGVKPFSCLSRLDHVVSTERHPEGLGLRDIVVGYEPSSGFIAAPANVLKELIDPAIG